MFANTQRSDRLARRVQQKNCGTFVRYGHRSEALPSHLSFGWCKLRAVSVPNRTTDDVPRDLRLPRCAVAPYLRRLTITMAATTSASMKPTNCQPDISRMSTFSA